MKVLIGLSFMGQGDPVWLIEPITRRIVARSVLYQAKCLRALRNP